MRVSTETRRQQLIDAAVTVLERDGVAHASLRTIAAEAGASLAAVHVCFANKDELIRGAIEGFLKQTWLDVGEGNDASVGLHDACYQILDGYWSAITLEPLWAVAQFEVGLWSIRQRQHQEIIRQIYLSYEARISTIIDDACARADETLHVPSSQVSRGILAIIDGCSLQYLADPLSPEHKRLANMMLDSLVACALNTGLPART